MGIRVERHKGVHAMKKIFAVLFLSLLSASAVAKTKKAKHYVPPSSGLRDGDIVPRPRGDNSAPGTIYIFAPSNKLTVHCLFEPMWSPIGYIRYDADRRRVWVQEGWPKVWHKYENVSMRRGLPPYNEQGVTLLAFDDVPIISFRIGKNPRNYQKHFEEYEIQAAWGILPGIKSGFQGKCRTETVPFQAQARN